MRLEELKVDMGCIYVGDDSEQFIVKVLSVEPDEDNFTTVKVRRMRDGVEAWVRPASLVPVKDVIVEERSV